MATQSSSGSTTETNATSSSFVNLRKQAKYVILGGIGVWYWQVSLHLTDALSGPGWTK